MPSGSGATRRSLRRTSSGVPAHVSSDLGNDDDGNDVNDDPTASPVRPSPLKKNKQCRAEDENNGSVVPVAEVADAADDQENVAHGGNAERQVNVATAKPSQSATAKPSQSATAKPSQSATAKPSQSATAKPSQSATAVGPLNATDAAPVSTAATPWALKLVEEDATVRLDLRLEQQLAHTTGAAVSSSSSVVADVSTLGSRATTQQLYKVETLACIERASNASTVGDTTANAEDEDTPCHAVASASALCLLAGTNIYLLDAEASAHHATIALDCTPDRAAFNRDARFLVVGDRLGTVHFVHVASQNVVFSQQMPGASVGAQGGGVEATSVFKQMVFASESGSPAEDLFILTSRGTLLRFANVNLTRLAEALSAGNQDLALQVKAAIRMETVGLCAVHDEMVASLAVRFAADRACVVACGKGRRCLSVWHDNADDDQDAAGKLAMVDAVGAMRSKHAITAVQLTKDLRCIVTLDAGGNVAVWDRRRLILLKFLPKTGIEDLTLIDSTPTDMHALVIRRIDAARHIQVLRLPSLVVQHTMVVADRCWLARSSVSSAEVTYFVEGRTNITASDNGNEDGNNTDEDKLYLRSISQTIPVNRFNELLLKRKFDEALVFARQYDLDEQVVLKSRLAEMLNGDVGDEVVCKMLADLELIKDDSFVISFAMEATLPTQTATWSLLSLAYRRACSVIRSSSQATTAAPQLITKAHQAVKRFGTFQLLTHGSEQGEMVASSFSAGEWHRFRVGALLDEVKSAFARGRIKDGIVLWRRHYMDENFLDSLAEVLDNIPHDVPSHHFTGWLSTEVLPRHSKLAERAKLGTWFEQRARLIEAADHKPHNALQLLTLLDVGCQMSDGRGVGTPKEYVEYAVARAATASYSTFGARACLSHRVAAGLRQQLEDMVFLWDENDYRISLADYSRETPNTIALALLDRVAAPELLPEMIDGPFRRYAERHSLDTDELLVDYCNEMMDNYNGNSPDSPWESRVLMVLPSITNVDRQLDIALEILRRSPIPWSTDVDQLITKTLQLEGGRRNEEFKEQYELMRLKKMLLGYGVKEFNVSDVAYAKHLVQMILKKTGNATALADAKQLVGTYHHLKLHDVYTSWMRNLCAARRPEDAVACVDEVPAGDAVRFCKEVLLWLQDIQHDAVAAIEANDPGSDDEYYVARFGMAASAAAVVAAKLQTLHAIDNNDCRQLIAINQLWSEFQIAVAPQSFNHTTERQRIMEKFVKKQLQATINIAGSNAKGKGKTGTIPSAVDSLNPNDVRFMRLAEILMLKKSTLLAILAKTAAACGKPFKAMALCNEILARDGEGVGAKSALDVAENLVRYLGEHVHLLTGGGDDVQVKTLKSIPSLAKKLAQQAAVSATEKTVGDALDAFKNYETLQRIFLQCQSGEYDSVMNKDASSARDHLADDSTPIFEHHFSDNGLVFNTEKALTLATDFALNCRAVHTEHTLTSVKSKGALTAGYYNGTDLLAFLQTNHGYQIALTAYQRVQEYYLRNIGGEQQMADQDWESSLDYYYSVARELLGKIFAHAHIDGPLAFGCMMALPQKIAFLRFRDSVSAINRDFHRLRQIAGSGLGAAALWQQRGFTVTIEALAKDAKWWEQLRLLRIPFSDDRYRAEDDYKRGLVPEMLRKTCFDVATVLDFGRDYNIEDDFVILEYIKVLLLEQNSSDDYQPRILGVIDDVSNRDKLSALLKTTAISLSPYDYDRIRFVFTLIARFEPGDDIAKKACLIVDILELYTRTTPPTMEEFDTIYGGPVGKTHEEYVELYTGCSKRLPYHKLVGNPWEVLQVELTEETLGRLLPLAIPLGLPHDHFYAAIVDGMLRKMGTGAARKFADFKPLVVKIGDHHLVSTTLLNIAAAFPCGVDRIQAYKAALNLAERHLVARKDAVVEEYVDQIKAELHAAELEHMLATAKLSEYFERAENGAVQLVTALYQDLSIPVLLKQKPYESLDLHQLCADIAEKCGEDIGTVRDSLLQDWIRARSIEPHVDLLPSVRFNFNEENLGQAELAVQYRLVYLCHAFPTDESISFLTKMAYEPSQKVSTTTRIRALCVLLQVASPADINKMQSYDGIRDYLQILFYLVDCEELRISVRTRELYSLEKVALARSLWVKRSNEPKVVEFICNLLLDYNVYSDLILWDSLLNKLIELGRYRMLMTVFERVPHDLYAIEGIAGILNKTVEGTIAALALDLDVDLAERLLQLFQQCPILSALDATAAMNYFTEILLDADIELGMKGIGALLPLVTDKETATGKLRQELGSLAKRDFGTLLDTIEHGYTSFGLYQNGFETLTAIIFDLVDDKVWYDLLLPRPTTSIQFSHFLVKCDRCDKLIAAMLKLKRRNKAADLLKLYFKRWPERLAAECTSDDDWIAAYEQRQY